MRESELVEDILLFFRNHPSIELWRVNRGKRGGVNFCSARGHSDIAGVARVHGFGCSVGLAVYVEAKSTGKTQSADQKDFQRRVERLGGLYILAYTRVEVITTLKSHGVAT